MPLTTVSNQASRPLINEKDQLIVGKDSRLLIAAVAATSNSGSCPCCCLCDSAGTKGFNSSLYVTITDINTAIIGPKFVGPFLFGEPYQARFIINELNLDDSFCLTLVSQAGHQCRYLYHTNNGFSVSWYKRDISGTDTLIGTSTSFYIEVLTTWLGGVVSAGVRAYFNPIGNPFDPDFLPELYIIGHSTYTTPVAGLSCESSATVDVTDLDISYNVGLEPDSGPPDVFVNGTITITDMDCT